MMLTLFAQTFVHDLKAEPEILPLVTLVTFACGYAVYSMTATLGHPEIALQKNHKSNWENMMEADGKSSDRAESC
jgi:hypothetical protein